MAARDRTRRRITASIGSVVRHHGEDDPRLPELRRDLRAAQLKDHVRQALGARPALTNRQRSEIAHLLLAA